MGAAPTQRSVVPSETAQAPHGPRSASEGKGDGPARFAAILDGRLAEPLTRAEATVLYLRLDRLLDVDEIQRITDMGSSVSVHLSRAYRKLGFPFVEHRLTIIQVVGWYQYERGLRAAG